MHRRCCDHRQGIFPELPVGNEHLDETVGPSLTVLNSDSNLIVLSSNENTVNNARYEPSDQNQRA